MDVRRGKGSATKFQLSTDQVLHVLNCLHRPLPPALIVFFLARSFASRTHQSIKFDDLCTDFQLHEALDDSSPYATMALDATGAVTGFEYVSGSGAGLVPLTVPTASAASVSYPSQLFLLGLGGRNALS